MVRITGSLNQNLFEPPSPVPVKQPAPNFIWLRSLAALPKLVTNPLETFAIGAFQDPVAYTRIFNQPIALVHDPELIRHIFIERADTLIADPLRQAVLKPALREGLLTAEGQTWRKSRRALAPVFAPRHVEGFSAAMKSVTDKFIGRWENGVDSIEIADEMTRLAYLVLSQTLFSGDLDEDSERVIGNVGYFLKHLSQPDPMDFLNAPEWVPRLTKLKGKAAVERLREGIRNTTEKRQAKIRNGEDVPEDFLTLLLQTEDRESGPLTLDETEDNIITFIAAGHETTARALAWTLYLLAHDTNARERCENEIDALDLENIAPNSWGKALPWTIACFEESMRLFPPAAIIARRTTEEINHPNGNVMANANLLVSPWVLHRHETLWEKPNAFDPNRFFGENRKNIHRFAYLPFGLGARVCIGASFAMQEAIIIMALMLKQYRFDYVGEKMPWPVMKITVQPDNGIPMKITPR